MNLILSALHNTETFVQGMSFEKKADGILPELRIIPIIKEYADFLRSLSFCKKIAVSEYEYVSGEIERVRKIGDDIRKIQEKTGHIRISTVNLDQDQVGDAPDQKKTAEALRNTTASFSQSLLKSIEMIQKETEQLKNELSDFKIVLFGKTKSGKSTVREALTNGNGASIGKGGQSTTIDIHEYQWYNLKVYDTPGTLSVRDTEKKEDGIGKEEREAYNLLLKSDIALFMFTSDNIEKAELDYLREICERGKDVLILLNVKSDLSDYHKYKLRKKDREVSTEFQKGNIERIAEALGNRKPVIIPFHAQAAFFSRGNNKELTQFYHTFDVTRSELYELSKFGEIRNYLVKNIIERGAAIRAETIRECFISHVKQFSEENRQPIEQCRKSTEQGLELFRKTKTKTNSIIASFGRKLGSDLKTELRARIDTHKIAEICIDNKYSKERIQSFWESQFSNEMIQDVCSGILQPFIRRITSEMEEMSRQLNFILETDADFEGFEADILPWGDILHVGGILAEIGAVILLALDLTGWGIALSLFGAFIIWAKKLFKSRERRIRELEEELDQNFERIIQDLTERFKNHCKKAVYPIIRGKIDDAISSQEELLKICDEHLTLNQKLFEIAEDNWKKLGPHVRQLVSKQKALLRRN